MLPMMCCRAEQCHESSALCPLTQPLRNTLRCAINATCNHLCLAITNCRYATPKTKGTMRKHSKTRVRAALWISKPAALQCCNHWTSMQLQITKHIRLCGCLSYQLPFRCLLFEGPTIAPFPSAAFVARPTATRFPCVALCKCPMPKIAGRGCVLSLHLCECSDLPRPNIPCVKLPKRQALHGPVWWPRPSTPERSMYMKAEHWAS